jgi:histidinol phosphatase-like enzyme (inositol monophosphatase family)
MDTTADPDPGRVKLAAQLADAARGVVLGYFRGAFDEADKADATPVTQADRAAERAMRDLIAAAYPDDGIIGEEYGTERPDAAHVWILDPIDGTKQFITGKPGFGTLIALRRAGRAELGVIEMPALGERWIGVRGRSTVHRDGTGERIVRTRACAELGRASFCVTGPDTFDTPERLARLDRLRAGARVTVYGGDCHNYGLLAGGFCDLVADGGMSTYDYAALVPVIEGAGGVVSDFAGNSLSAGDADVLAAGDPRVHAAALRCANG